MISIRRVKERWNRSRTADTIQNFVKMDEMIFLHMELHSAENGVKWWLKIYKQKAVYMGCFFCRVRLAAHVSNGLKSRIRPVVGRI